MKIAIFTDNFLPQINGVVTHIIESTKILRGRGHNILIFAPKPADPIKKQALPGVKLHYLPAVPNPIYKDFRITLPLSLAVLNIVREFQPDVIHFHTPVTVGSSGIMVSKLLKIPLVGTFHTYFMEPEYLRVIGLDKVGLDTNLTINKIGWFYNNLFYNSADVVISPSQFTKKELLAHDLIRPIKVIPVGVSLNISGSKNTSIKKFRLPKLYFLFIGRISPEKNIDKLIEAFYKFSRNDTEYSLVIVGDGPAREKLQTLTKSYKLEQRVIFLGPIPHEILMKSNIIRNAIAFVTASTSENQPISILETLLFGLPIIGVKAKGIPELVSKNGILCEPDDTDQFSNALRTIATSPKLRSQYGRESLKSVKKYSMFNTVKKLESLYVSLLKK